MTDTCPSPVILHLPRHAVLREEGHDLFLQIDRAFRAGQSVDLYCGACETLCVAFSNAFFGRLFEQWTAEFVAQRLQLLDIGTADFAILRLVQDNAVKFYGKKT